MKGSLIYEKGNVIHSIFFFCLIIGIVFTNLPFFPNNTVTHSLMFLIAPIIFFILFSANRFKLTISSNLKIFILYGILTLASSLILLIIAILLKGGDFYTYEKNLFLKLFEAFFSLFVLHFMVYCLLLNIFLRIRENALKKYITILFMFLTLIGFVEFISPDIIEFFHAKPKEYNRLRLFNLEPSQAVLVYTIFFFLFLFFRKESFIKIFSIIMYLLMLILISSKGIFISLIIAFIIMIFRYTNRVKYLISYSLLIVILILIFGQSTLHALLIDIEKFTSFSTRFSGLLSMILILFYYPAGTGYGTYLEFYPAILEKSYSIANNIFLNLFGVSLSFEELNSMISTGINLGAKASIPQFVMIAGWFGIFFWVFIVHRTLSSLKKSKITYYQSTVIRFMIILIIIQLLIGSEYTLLYVIWVPFALVEALHIKTSHNYGMVK